MSQALICSAMNVAAPPLLVLNKVLQHRHHTAVDVCTQSGIVGKLATGFDQKPTQMRLKHRIRAPNVLFEKAAKARPHAVREIADAWVGNEIALKRLEPCGVLGRARNFIDE